jgi:Transposase DDE domain/Transposase domain (DUF772)
MPVSLAQFWSTIQGSLFPYLAECLPEPFTEKQKQLVTTFEVLRIEEYVQSPSAQIFGRPECDRRCLARAFVTKAVYDLPTNELLIEMLQMQPNLRRLCGWEMFRQVPSASTFSRAFAEFAQNQLGDQVHLDLVERCIGDQVVLHNSRDSTEVVARERPARKEEVGKEEAQNLPAAKRGRPKKGEPRPAKEPTRLEKQMGQSAAEALAALPRVCDWGTKRDTGGHKHTWKGWKAHIDWADGCVPLTVVTTSASVHDSQVAIPLARRTAERVVSVYDLMDSAYDAPQIRQVSQELGHVALIEANPRRHGVPEEKLFDPAMTVRYKERTTAERGNSRLKDSFGLRHLRVRGYPKAHLHIMFSILALFADQVMKPWTG